MRTPAGPSGAGPKANVAVVRTVCPRNCYCTCGMVVTLEDGRIARIDGDPHNAATRGHVCLKGISYARRVTTDARLLHPQRRRQDGSFEQVSWEDALTDIASRLDTGAAGARPGVRALLRSVGQPRRARPPGHGVLAPVRRVHAHLWRPLLAGRARGHAVDLRRGSAQPPAAHRRQPLHPAVGPQPGGDERPPDAVGPRGPGTRGNRRAHRPAKHRHRGRRRHPSPAEAWHRRGAGAGHGPNHRRGRAARRGVPRAARARVRPLSGAASRLPARARRRPHRGAGHHHRPPRPRLRAPQAGADHRGVRPATSSPRGPDDEGGGAAGGADREHRGGGRRLAVRQSQQPLPARPAAAAGAGGRAPRDPGFTARAGALGDRAPRVAAAWVEKGNPASQNPRSLSVRKAFEQLDLLVVVDQFMTDTARLAHYVLPAKTMFEQEDLVTAYWHPYLQLRTKLWDPPGDVKTESEIWRLLSERLGFDTRFFPRDDDETRQVLQKMLPADKPGSDSLWSLLASRPIDPTGAGDVAFANPTFETPSGKIEFASEEAARLWGVDPVPDYAPLEEGHESLLASRYPLQLLSCKTRDRIHSQFGNLDWVRDVERPHGLDMHPKDAEARGLSEGDAAVLWNDRGRITLRVRLDEGLRPGVVHVLEGRCHEGDPDVNVLTDAGVTDMNHGATFYECLVEVERVSRRSLSVGTSMTTPRAEGRKPPLGFARGAPSDSRGARAGTKPPETERDGFLIDLGRCVGCGACVLACRLENGWSSDNPWRRVLPLNLRRRPGGPTYFLSVACHHCERPACVSACPSLAYEKRSDGVVVHHSARCIGCRYCEMACPFGAPKYDASEGVMTKCDFCRHENTERVDRPGLVRGAAGALVHTPACIAACPTEALRPLSAAGSSGEQAESMPGFTDPAACGPNIRFVSPRGARRASLLNALHERLGRR